MPYIVEQKIKGKIYLYEVESYWDKTKKQPRQHRKYIGPKENRKSVKTDPKQTQLISKHYGDVFLLECIASQLGLSDIVKSHFPKQYQEILALSYFEILEGAIFYLFPYWRDEHYLPRVRKMHSSHISQFVDTLGRNQVKRHDLLQQWINTLKPIQGVYYDITSISSYSTKIDFIEWGYNRDHEALEQLNMGVVFSEAHGLPMYYHVYPGSIVDVTTLKNCITYLSAFDVKNILMILDRGFFSKTNILELNQSDHHISFIQPLPFRLKQVRSLVRKKQKQFKSSMHAFKYHEEVLYYFHESMEIDDLLFDAHVYINEKAEVEQRHHFLSNLLDIEEKLKDKHFDTLKTYLTYKKTYIPEKDRDYFKWNKTTGLIQKNTKKINSALMSMGSFILMTNKKDMNKVEVLDYYRRRDAVEKIFDITKNKLDADRLRAHGTYSNDGRLFIQFIASILYAELEKTMRKKKLFEIYSVKELLLELKKIKVTLLDNQKPIISEITKKQKNILESFEIKEVIVHAPSY